MNIDYAVCGVLNLLHQDLDKSLLIYDVICEWSVNFRKRVNTSSTLSIPAGLGLTYAVGKFHLGAHIPDCFHKFSLNFMKGAGQIEGEIIETLWEPLNKVKAMTRAMSKAHRAEIIDALMNDSNWKKTIGIGMPDF